MEPDPDAGLPARDELCRSLLDATDQGFCIVEVRFDEAGRALDHRVVETNAAFAAQTGLHDVVGPWMRDLVPDHEQFWCDRYGDVARTRQPLRFEHRAAALGGRWYQVQAFPVGTAGRHLVGVLFSDISARKTAEAALRAGEARFRAIAELNPDALLILSGGRILYANQAAQALLRGHVAGDPIGFPLQRFFVGDFPAAAAAARQKIFEQGEIIRQVEQRWRRLDGSEFTAEITAGALIWEEAPAVQVIVRDISARKELERRQILLSREVDHRAKNLLAVVQALMQLTQADTVADFVRRVEGRIAALARAHRLLASGGWAGADLPVIVQQELAPYGGEGAGRVVLAGASVKLRADAVQPFAMVLHELATNAVKYGALCRPGGRVLVEWDIRPDGSMILRWREEGGPAIDAPPVRHGFGKQLIETTAQQLGGAVQWDWHRDGVRCEFWVPAGNFDVMPADVAPAAMPRGPAAESDEIG